MHNRLPMVLFSCLLYFVLSITPYNLPTMLYQISFENPLSHIIKIVLTISPPDKDFVDLQLPSWRPGRYEMANYAQNIYKVSSNYDNGKPLKTYKIAKDRWRIEVLEKKSIVIHYSYYAYQPDAGGSVLNEDMLYINFINCMIVPSDRMHEECEVELRLPETWRVAVGLPFQNGVIHSGSYFQLVDSPLIAAPDLTHWGWSVNSWDFHIWFKGTSPLNREKVISDFSAFIKEQVNMMESHPSEPYHFIFYFPEYRFHHGVEHCDSSVIFLGPKESLSEEDLYVEFLGISSHELFHSWNITRLRPQELHQYDFSKEVYFETGFVAEGITTYYGDLFLVRSGVISFSLYLKELNGLLKKHFENFGRYHLSLAESSYDLWLDGYKPGIPNRKVSIYIKGAIISLMLDLTIRTKTGNNVSLDDLLRFLWKEYYLKNRGYSVDDLKAGLLQISGIDFNSFFESFIYGNLPLEKTLLKIFEPFGLKLVEETSDFFWEKDFGFRIDPVSCRVIKIDPHSSTVTKLGIDDLILKMNNKDPADFIAENIRTEKLNLLVKRMNMQKEVHLTLGGMEYFKIYQIIRDENLTDRQLENLKQWLKIT